MLTVPAVQRTVAFEDGSSDMVILPGKVAAR
jgi:hypothetical protein